MYWGRQLRAWHCIHIRTVNPISLTTIMFNVFAPVGMLTSIKLNDLQGNKNDIFYKNFQQLYSIRERIHCSVVSKMPTVSNGFLIVSFLSDNVVIVEMSQFAWRGFTIVALRST